VAEVVKIQKDTEILLFFGKRVGLGINAGQSNDISSPERGQDLQYEKN
jgi:hypothetical protein